VITFEQGKPGEAETMARKAIAIFEQYNAPGSASIAYSVLGRSLAAEGKLAEARSAGYRAVSLAQQGTDRIIRLQAGLASAEIEIQSGKAAEAARHLGVLRQETSRDGYVVYELQARLLLAEAQFKSGNAALARTSLEKLQSDARAKGFLLVARRSNALLHS
jgi:ATP/maltotriose-dependent transcriptional regulator MalT